MVAIGEFQLAVLKAIAAAGGTYAPGVALDIDCTIDGDLTDAVARLAEAEYLDPSGDGAWVLSEIAEEYLEALGVL